MCIALLAGCADSQPTTKSSANRSSAKPTAQAPPGPDARELLSKLRSVYRDAKSYTDNTVIVFHAVLRAKGTEVDSPFTRMSVAFERPNKLHVSQKKFIASPQEETYEIVANRSTIRSVAGELPDQVQEAIAPLKLTTDNFIPEPQLRGEMLDGGIENVLPQLALLLAADAETKIFPGEAQPRALRDAELEGKPYHRVEISSPVGKRILWIDPQQSTLRRMEIPIENQRQEFNAHNQYLTFSVWIDFEDVTLNSEIQADTFELAVPDGVRRVRRFILPPPDDLAEPLGKPVGPFEFSTLEGESITPASLAGKVVVLDFWFTGCPPCKAHTPVLNEVYQQFADSEDVAFLAVSTDSRAISNEVVAKTLASWGGDMPVVRDLQSTSYRELGVRQTPTLILVDRQGRLQSFKTGEYKSAEPLAKAIERLVAGENLVAAARDKHAEYVAKYEQALAAATISDSLVEVQIERPEVPKRKLSKKLQLKQLWQTTSDEVERPGAVLVSGDNERVLVLDGGQAIVEFDTTGKLLTRHALPEHPERTGGFLRTWGGDDGQRWYLASGVGWQQAFVFNKKWESELVFPDEPHSGIGDVLFTDLTNSGTPVMYVGYWGGWGIHAGTLEGRRPWTNRKLDHVLQIGVGPTQRPKDQFETASLLNRTLLCSSTRGTLLQLAPDGKPLREWYVPGHAIVYFAGDENREYCGLSVTGVGQYTAVGFDGAGVVHWEYPLPAGEYVEQVPRVQSVHLPSGDAGWLIVAANGSLHWLASAGDLIDRFDTGDILTGVAEQTVDGKTLLFTATAEQLRAWEVRLPPVVTDHAKEEATDDTPEKQADTDEAASE